jgi:hypothetical protein
LAVAAAQEQGASDLVSGRPIPAKDFAGIPTHKVLRVVDGDTVVLLVDGKETTVRLTGVDTPETVHPVKPVEAYGKEASRVLRLDQLGLRNPKETLRHLRRTGQLGHVKVAGKVLIPRQDIEACLERHRVSARA